MQQSRSTAEGHSSNIISRLGNPAAPDAPHSPAGAQGRRRQVLLAQTSPSAATNNRLQPLPTSLRANSSIPQSLLQAQVKCSMQRAVLRFHQSESRGSSAAASHACCMLPGPNWRVRAKSAVAGVLGEDVRTSCLPEESEMSHGRHSTPASSGQLKRDLENCSISRSMLHIDIYTSFSRGYFQQVWTHEL